MGTDTATTTIHASKGRCLEYLIGIQTRPARYWEVSLDVPRCLTIREELNVARVLLSVVDVFHFTSPEIVRGVRFPDANKRGLFCGSVIVIKRLN